MAGQPLHRVDAEGNESDESEEGGEGRSEWKREGGLGGV